MREKEAKEKLLFKKDENGKRFLYISMGRFPSDSKILFSNRIFFDSFLLILTEVKPSKEEKLEMEKRWIQNNVIRKRAAFLHLNF